MESSVRDTMHHTQLSLKWSVTHCLPKTEKFGMAKDTTPMPVDVNSFLVLKHGSFRYF